MNARQEAKLNMYRAVLQQSEENTQLIQSVPAFEAAMAAFKTSVAAVLSTVQQQLQVTSGATVSKAAAKKDLCTFTVDVAAAMFAYASATGNLVLKEQSRITLSELLRAKDEVLTPRCRNYFDLAKNNADALRDYGITEALITSFKNALDNYSTAVPTPRNAIAQRAAYRKNLGELVKQADGILKERLDKLVKNFKTSGGAYYNAYKSNRTILNPGKTVTQLKISVTTGAGTAIPGAELEVVEQGQVFKSNTKGNILVKPVSPGTYTLKISAPGYETQTLPEIKITMGQINSFPVNLKHKG